MLNWNPTDFLECLGVVPSEAEHGICHTYEVGKDGIRLELAVSQYDGDVHVTVWRDGVAAPVIEVRLVDCDAARWVHDQRGNYIEFAAGRLFGGRFDGSSVIPYGVRVRVEPSIGVEIFHSAT